MAAITFNATHQNEHVREQLKTVLAAVREMLDIPSEVEKVLNYALFFEEYANTFKNYHGFPYACCMSVNDAVVHGFPTKDELKEGDVISVDCGALRRRQGDWRSEVGSRKSEIREERGIGAKR